MKKLADQGFFDDGLVYLFDKADINKKFKPKHIRYEIQTSEESADMESCDFRLTTYTAHVAPAEPEEKPQYEVETSPIGPPGFDRQGQYDVGFVRLGYFNYLKLNTESMVMKFATETWYSIDLLIDWDEQQIIIRSQVTGNTEKEQIFSSRQPFFTKRKQRIDSANGISIYGLTPGSVSRFKNIKVCTEFCPGKSHLLNSLMAASNTL